MPDFDKISKLKQNQNEADESAPILSYQVKTILQSK